MHGTASNPSPSTYTVSAVDTDTVTVSWREAGYPREKRLSWATLREAARHEDAAVAATYQRLLASARQMADQLGLRATRYWWVGGSDVPWATSPGALLADARRSGSPPAPGARERIRSGLMDPDTL
jgi:hypothetical protein